MKSKNCTAGRNSLQMNGHSSLRCRNRKRTCWRDLRSLKSEAYFVLQLGYFKAKRLFFVFDLAEVKDDTDFVLQQHFGGRTLEDWKAVDKKTRLKQQRLILQLFRSRVCTSEDRANLNAKAAHAAAVCGKPVYIFRELTRYLEEHRIVVPGYSFMQDTVGAAITAEQNRLASIVRRELPAFCGRGVK